MQTHANFCAWAQTICLTDKNLSVCSKIGLMQEFLFWPVYEIKKWFVNTFSYYIFFNQYFQNIHRV